MTNSDTRPDSVMGKYPSPDRDAFPDGDRVVNQACHSLRAKVQRAVKRRTGCRLTADEAFALDFMEGDGDWWNEPIFLAAQKREGKSA